MHSSIIARQILFCHIGVEPVCRRCITNPSRHLLDTPGNPRLCCGALELGRPLDGPEPRRQQPDQLLVDVVYGGAHLGKRVHYLSLKQCVGLISSYNASVEMALTMVRENEIRDGEIAIAPPPATDAGLVFIGRIRTALDLPLITRVMADLTDRSARSRFSTPGARRWMASISSSGSRSSIGSTFRGATWSGRVPTTTGLAAAPSLARPVRPNPIGTSIVGVVGRDGPIISVRGLDCLDGTPLLDIKPDRTLFKPIAPPQPGDFETDQELTCRG